MTNLYFEELEIGTRSAAGPYLVPKDKIIQFAKQYDPVSRHIDEEAAARSIFGGLHKRSDPNLKLLRPPSVFANSWPSEIPFASVLATPALLLPAASLAVRAFEISAARSTYTNGP